MMRFLLLFILLFSTGIAHAENMLMLRINMSFDDSLILLEEKLNDYGYTVSHIQKCDGGLKSMGYRTDQYNSVFFGKFDETRQLTTDFPEIVPYLPLKVAVIKEADSIILSLLNPAILVKFFQQPALVIQFKRWESDFRAILKEIQQQNLSAKMQN